MIYPLRLRLARVVLCLGLLLGLLGDARADTPVTVVTDLTFQTGDTAYSGLATDAEGNLYGTTSAGGPYGGGDVFKIEAGTRALTVLAGFGQTNQGDASPAAPCTAVTLDSAGDIFGTTQGGGPANLGTVYEIPAGTHTLKTLIRFVGANGADPYGGLVMDRQGNLFGTAAGPEPDGHGIVYELPAAGRAAGRQALTVLATFDGVNGGNPIAGLVMDAGGDLFGTTPEGGTNGQGTVWELPAGSHMLKVLASFSPLGGAEPHAGVVFDAHGNLYGTTLHGGISGDGTVWELPAGGRTLITLASFTGVDGSHPCADLVLDSQGDLFSVTLDGGPANAGTVFELKHGSRKITTLIACHSPGGTYPYGVLLDARGDLFGVTRGGGGRQAGQIFEIAHAGSAPAEAHPAVARGGSVPTPVAAETTHILLPPARPPWAEDLIRVMGQPVGDPPVFAAQMGGLPLRTENALVGDGFSQFPAGTADFTVAPDLWVNNDSGNDCVFQRCFRTDRAEAGYGSPGLSPGWVHGFDVILTRAGAPKGTLSLVYPNGAHEMLTAVFDAKGVPMGKLTPPVGTPYGVRGIYATGTWRGILVSWADADWLFTPFSADTYVLSAVGDLDLDWDAARRLRAVRSEKGKKLLLTLNYDEGGHLKSLTDFGGRQILYTFAPDSATGLVCLAGVSLVTTKGAARPLDKFQYEYQAIAGQPFLHTTKMPRPGSPGLTPVH